MAGNAPPYRNHILLHACKQARSEHDACRPSKGLCCCFEHEKAPRPGRVRGSTRPTTHPPSMPNERSRPPRREPYHREKKDGTRERVQGVYFRRDTQGRQVFEIGFRDSDGRQRYETVGGGVTAAEQALRDHKARMGRGERVAPKPTLTFGEAAERWQKSQVTALRPSTQKAYGAHLRTHLLPRWRKRRLDTFTVDDMARLIEELRANGKKAWTIRGCLVVSGRVFDFAGRRLGWAGSNPVRQLDRRERPASDQEERRVLTGAELERLLAVAPERARLLLAFAASTGVRLGEALGVTWRSLDLDAGTASITHQTNREGARVELKTKRSRRIIELPGSLVAALREHKVGSSHSRADDPVFATRTGRAVDHRSATRLLAKAIEDAKLDPDAEDSKATEPTPTFHSLRHTFASAWIAAGGDLVELSAHLGHRDPAITASVYAHEFERASRSDERRARLDAMFGSSVVAPVVARDGSKGQEASRPAEGEIVNMQEVRDGRQ